MEPTFRGLCPEAPPRLRPEEVIGRVKEDGTLVSHHPRCAPQDEIRDVYAAAGIVRFRGDLGMSSTHGGRDQHEVESLM
jgi:hypothetical protein